MRCHCGKVVVRKAASEVVVTCEECGWHHTYKAVPKRVFTTMAELLAALQKFREEYAPTDEEDG